MPESTSSVGPDLPSGTVTFLFTDIEGSTRLWEQHPDAMPGVLEHHDAILRRAVETTHHRGVSDDIAHGAHRGGRLWAMVTAEG